MSNSITVQVMESVKEIFEKELQDSNSWLETTPYEKVFDFLNDRKNLCTPGFILRRHIQIYLPKLVKEAVQKSGVKDVADLTTNENVAWDENFVKELAQLLNKSTFTAVENLNIDARQWENFLNDNSLCNRETAIKIIFALNLPEATAEKFLIANGKNLFNTRNPADYLYNFCRKCNFTYDTALELLKKFETGRSPQKNAPKNLKNATTLMENETQRISKNDKLSDEEKKRQILQCMFQYSNEFVEKIKSEKGKEEYPSGFSRQHTSKLKIFLKYLTDLYPKFLHYVEKNQFEACIVEKEIPRNTDGSPKSPINLEDAMKDMQEIYIKTLEELAELGLTNESTNKSKENENENEPTKKTRMKPKREYNEIPFNAEIILPLKNLSQTLRATLRVDYPNNAHDVERSTILFLTYFFICGCRMLDDDALDNFAGRLQVDIDSSNDEVENNLRYALQNVIGKIQEFKEGESIISTAVDSLNSLLESFDCTEFYAPFVIDRCILLCLAILQCAENDEKDIPYFMAQLIEQSYSLSKKEIESRKKIMKN